MGRFAWFVLGLILGAAIALAGVTLAGRDGGGRDEPEASDLEMVPITPSPDRVEPIAPAAAAPPPAVERPSEAAPPAPEPEDEAQVAEDAAAAGMTSRSRRGDAEPAEEPASSE